MHSAFRIDPRLEADTVPVAALDLCDVRLMDDMNYPWTILVPRLTGAVELADIPHDLSHRLMDETAAVSAGLRRVTGCDKLNVATLGNQVRQLHVHVIARFRSDAAWPGPVWGRVPRRAYDSAELEALVERLRTELG